MASSAAGSQRGGRASVGLPLALVALTAAIFADARLLGFVFDDADYILRNTAIGRGLSADGLAWAFTSTYAANWHPLTWLSHMLDVQLYGLRPAGHHVSSVLLHAGNAVLLFVTLRAYTGSTWRSAAVAALFAAHPLRVESVAWVAERKDVLSAFFALATLLAYRRHVAAPAAGRYIAVVAAFTLGLLSKPMLVSLPFALLLLDYWPLGRFPAPAPRAAGQHAPRVPARLVTEKIPLVLLAAASAAVTYLAQVEAGALASGLSPGLGARAANAAVSYARYLGKTIWPLDLAAFYPYPLAGHPAWQVWGAVALLALVTTACVAARRRAPWLAVSWHWFLVTLLPVIGLVQAGRQALADRYTYLPHVGLLVLCAWGAAALARSCWARRAVAPAFVVTTGVLAVLAARQVQVWRDDLTLARHAVNVTQGNSYMLYNLGVALGGSGRLDEAIASYREALRVFPAEPDAHYNLALSLSKLGRQEEAIENYRLALIVRPGDASAHNNLGALLYARGMRSEGIAHFRRALELRPDHVPTRRNLERALAGAGETTRRAP